MYITDIPPAATTTTSINISSLFTFPTTLYPEPTISIEPVAFPFPTPPRPPNYINPETRAPLIIAVNVVCILLGMVAVGIRTWNRSRQVRSMRWDDWLAAMAWVGV